LSLFFTRRALAVHNSTGTDQVVAFVLYKTCSGCAQQHRNWSGGCLCSLKDIFWLCTTG